jgi:hypothetical protein
MRCLALVFSLLVSLYASTQQVVDVASQDVRIGYKDFFVSGNEPFVTTKFVNLVEGSPYFKDEWMKAVVVDKMDRVYKDIQIRVDLFGNKIHFLGDKEQEFVATIPLKQLVLTDGSGNNYRFDHSNAFEKVNNAERDRWYLWLASGPASLYKKIEKDLSEFRPYASSVVEQRIKTNERYIVLYKDSFHEVKKLKDVPSVLVDKKKELEDFLKTKDDDKASMDDRMVSVIQYYNSLQAKKGS